MPKVTGGKDKSTIAKGYPVGPSKGRPPALGACHEVLGGRTTTLLSLGKG